MKLFKKLLTGILSCAVPALLFSQDFSNKGKDFWVIYTGHVDGTNSRMALYITSDQDASGTVDVAGSIINFTVTANQVTTIRITNTSNPSNALVYNGQTVGIGAKRGIHIRADHAVVVYSHILNAARSGSTLVLPTNVLGREYYVASYASVNSATGIRRSEFAVVATQDNTTIEIVPRQPDASNTYAANVPFQVTLNTGDVFQYQTANDGDLTGTYIKSIATATSPCKPIAVFSGSTWTGMGCSNPGSGDNLYQQLFPFASWGQYYVTAPFKERSFDIFRILVRDPATVVQVNGTALNPATLINNRYYEFNTSGNNTPRIITSNQPICVMQYMITQNCDGVESDPEMIILNSIEQTLNDITVLSARNNLTPPNTNITRHFLNIIVKTSALGSLKIDGASYTSAPVPIATTQYSYLQEEVTGSTNVNPSHRITCDSGFVAIAYGYGAVESYGYNAGANIRDLYQYVSILNQYATVNFPATCTTTPFYFRTVFPYQPTQIQWVFGPALNAIGIADVTISNPVYDSTWMISGKQVYRYDLPLVYSIPVTGTYPIKIIANNPTADGCGGIQEIDYDLQVFKRPSAGFYFNTNGCVTSPVNFFDTSNTGGRAITQWNWNFGDAATATTKNPSHTYGAQGSYLASLSVLTDIGCSSDPATRTIIITQPPQAKFGASLPNCVGRAITFTDSSTGTAGSVLTKWYWNFGDGSPQVTSTTGTPQAHTYTSAGTYTATLKVEATSGCQSLVFTKQIIINSNPVASFTMDGNVCLPQGTANFVNGSTMSDGTGPLLTYLWNFGDGNTSTATNPVHNFVTGGPFPVTLTATSNNGCIDDTVRTIANIYAQPQAAFNAPSEVCLGAPVNFSDQSTATNSTVTQWAWDFGDGTTSTLQNPVKNYSVAGTYTVKLKITSSVGCVSTTATKTVIVNARPIANYTTSTPACAKRNLTFTDASVPNAGNLVKWTWNFGDGNSAVVTNPGPFTHNYANAGTFDATLQVETNNGCVSTVVTKPIIINIVPDAGFISPEICLADPSAPFMDTSKISTGSITGWQWNFGDPNANAGNPNTSTLQNPTHRYTVVGNYTATLVATSNTGCTDTIAQTFTVNGSVPLASFTVQNTNELCSNKDIIISDASSVDFGNIVRTEIYWDWTNDPTIKTTDELPAAGKLYTHSYPAFGAPATKTYTIRMISYSGISCLNVSTKTITVLAAPTLRFDAMNEICSNGDPFQITEAGVTNGVSGTGVFSGPGVSSSGLFNPTVAGAGTHTIRYTFSSSNSCGNYIEQVLVVNPTPNAFAGPDKTLLEGGVVQLTPALNAGFPVTYTWSPPSGLDNPNSPDPLASPADDITYTLKVTSDKGCNASDQVSVRVLKKPEIPNIFSPNGDGIHDKWVVSFLESYPGCTVEIFNRYGQRVYYSIGYSNPWDGTINGKVAPVGTYYYIVDPKNGRQKLAGYVDIVR